MKTLLHACCGPCSSACIPRLTGMGGEVAVFFCNSNIDTPEEFGRRKEAAAKVAEAEGVPFFSEPYDHGEWLERVASGFEDCGEGGARCGRCFKFNLEKTAAAARRMGFDSFTTSLTVSPHKYSPSVFVQGAAAEKTLGGAPRFLAVDFKKQNGFAESVRRSAELGLYRQSYCGCEFSRRKGKDNG